MTLDQLRAALDHLESSVQRAGAALIAAEESGADETDVTRLLRAYGIHGRTKLGWLRDGGELLRWHRGEAPCASAQQPEQDTRELDVSSRFIENPSERCRYGLDG